MRKKQEKLQGCLKYERWYWHLKTLRWVDLWLFEVEDMISYNFFLLTGFSFQNYAKIFIFSSFIAPLGLKGSDVLRNCCSCFFVFLTSYGGCWELKLVLKMCWMILNMIQKERVEIFEHKVLFCSATKLPYFRSALHFILLSRFWSDFWKAEGYGRIIDHVKPSLKIQGPKI